METLGGAIESVISKSEVATTRKDTRGIELWWKVKIRQNNISMICRTASQLRRTSEGARTPTSYKIVKAQTGRRRRWRRHWPDRRTVLRRRVRGRWLVVKQLAHTGDSPPVTNSTWIHTRHVHQIQTSLMLDQKNERDFRYSRPCPEGWGAKEDAGLCWIRERISAYSAVSRESC